MAVRQIHHEKVSFVFKPSILLIFCVRVSQVPFLGVGRNFEDNTNIDIIPRFGVTFGKRF